MPVEWAGLGPELLVRLDRTRSEPLRAQLEEGLRAAIRSGQLAAGERLPSSRKLAAELGLSRGLVLDCYSQLQAEGYLSAKTGSATRVAAGAQPVDESAPAPDAEPRFEFDFQPSRPDLTSFPRGDWAWAVRDAVRNITPRELAYGDPRGSAKLREVLAAYLRRVRGAVADPDQIVVCSGFAQGINLILRELADRGARDVGFEDPGSVDFEGIEDRWRMKPHAVPVDELGIDAGALAAGPADAVVLTPAHQFPTGVVLAPGRRQELVDWAARCDGTIIEDDYDAEFRYDREPVGAVQGLAPDRVALIGTVSKSLAPTVRLGWIVSPPDLAGPIAERKEREDRGSPGIDQLALARLIESGRYDRHLRRMRGVYATRRAAVLAALARHAPSVTASGLAAGFHAVANLAPGVDGEAVAAAARERSVRLYPIGEYGTATGPDPRIVLGFGNMGDNAIDRGIERVADLLSARH